MVPLEKISKDPKSAMLASWINSRSNRIFWLTLLLLGGIGIGLTWYATAWGPGLVDWDSFNYVAGARSLAAGRGYLLPVDNQTYEPLTHFPPGLSIALGIFERLGVDSVPAARYLNALLFGCSVVLVSLITRKATRSALFGIMAGLLFLSSALLLDVYSWLLSEPLFLFCSLLGFYLLSLYLGELRISYLIFTSLALGYAFLTRYVGAANVVAAALALALNGTASINRKLRDVTCLALIAGLPAAFVTFYNYLQTQTINDRELGWHPLTPNNLANAFHTFYTWFLPEKLVIGFEKVHFYVTFGIILLIILLAAIYGLRKQNNVFYLAKLVGKIPPIIQMYLLFFFTYIIVVFAAKTFLDSNMGMSDRIFSPDYVAFIVLVIWILGMFWNVTAKNSVRALVVSLIAYLLVYNLAASVHSVPLMHERGLGLGRKSFYNSQALQELKSLAAHKTIFSNYSYALYLHTGQVGYPLGAFGEVNIDPQGTVVAIFTFRLDEPHSFINKNSDKLELITEDHIVSVYRVKSR